MNDMSDLAAAKAQLAFAELTGGVRFSGRKHGRDMAVFNRGKKSQQSGVGGGGAVGTRDDDDAALLRFLAAVEDLSLIHI